jgi:four helix bundle protein
MSIAYKEADETDFWLNLLHDNGYLDDKQFDSLNKDITRILKILTSIVKTMRTKLGLEKS